MKIILLDHEPYCIKRKKFFYIDELIQSGFEVEVWSMTNCILPQYNSIPDQLNDSYVYSISSLESFRDRINLLGNDLIVFICEIAFNWRNRLFWRILNKKNFIKIKIDPFGNNISKYESSLSLISKLKNNFNNIGSIFLSKLESVRFNIYTKIHSIEGVKYIFSSSWYYSNKININHPDFEDFINQENRDVDLQSKFILFIDNYVPNHPDIIISMGHDIPSTTEYQNNMKLCFDYLEEKYGIPVVIAAHPKSSYNGFEFGNRKIIKYQTNSLVANAEKIILHSSNSLSYISLYNKPLLLVSTNEIEKIEIIKRKMKWISIELDIPVFNISIEGFEKLCFKQIPSKNRLQYKYSYLTSKETENKRNSDIIISFLKDIKE